MQGVTSQHGAGTAAEAFAGRDAAGISLVAQADAVAEAAFAIAQRFRAGGTLLAFGNGNAGTDAAHLAVEFMHPVIVGKPALPAIALGNDIATVTGVAAGWREAPRDGRPEGVPESRWQGGGGFGDVYAHQVRAHARSTDVALAISVRADCPSIRAGLLAARELGLLTVLLTGCEGASEGLADHVLRVDATDPAIVKEIHVTIYHLLWELVHVLLEQAAVAA